MKILVIPSELKHLNLPVDGYVIGIDGLSVNMPCFPLKEIKKIKNKTIFVSINKNIANSDLDYLKKTLLELNDLINGVIFYDVSIVNLKEELKLKYDLIWGQEHHTTNYLTSVFWSKYNVSGMYLSNDITLKEMKEIIKKTPLYTMVTLFGYLPICTSKRKLITNYLKTFALKPAKTYEIKESTKKYPINENNDGTVVYTDFILNGLEEMLELKTEYTVLNSWNIPNFEEVLTIFKEVTKQNLEESKTKLEKLINNLDKGFLYEETIYKVRK